MIAADGQRLTFSKGDRLRTSGEFRKVFDNGRRLGGRKVRLYVLENGTDRSRLGLSIGKKAGNAVRRNRIRRVLREAFRLNRHILSPGYDIVMVATRGWGEEGLGDVEPEIVRLFQKLCPGSPE